MIREDAQYNYQLRGYELDCLQCGKRFVATRCDAKFCSGNCRKNSARRKDMITRAANKALREVEFIRRMAQQYPDLDIHAGLELDRLAEALNVSCRLDTDKASSVTTAGRTDSAIAVNGTLASATDKQICPKCGRQVDYISVFFNACMDCWKKEKANA